jgi:hypothetical protein
MLKSSGAGANVWSDLNRKFNNNLSLALAQDETYASKAEVQARAIPAIAKILRDKLELTDWQRDALCMFDEVFADLICSIYLSACGLDKPAQMILRRALEVGVATVYVWDLPHVFWGWKDHDKDLNFNEMLDHFASQGFNSLVRNQNALYVGGELIDAGRARSLYRNLSNIVLSRLSWKWRERSSVKIAERTYEERA